METEYEWDEAKRQANIDKHGIDFEAAKSFPWETAHIRLSSRRGEPRYVATGYIGDRLFSVVYTYRGDGRRIISLRSASPRERREYEHSH